MKRTNNILIKIVSLCTLVVIPTLSLVACGTPSSNKYLTAVSQFNNLLEKPDEADSKKIQVNYSLLVRSSQTPIKSEWSYIGEEDKTIKKPLNNEVDARFLNVYGNLVNSIAYNIVRPAATLATTVSGYNNSLPADEQMTFFNTDTDGQTNDVIHQFHQAMSNNLNVANNQSNVGFGVSDISFKFQLLDSSTGTPINTNGTDGKGTIDGRVKNTDFKNENNEIVWPYKNDEDQKNNKPDSSLVNQNNDTANRLTKLVAVTDINVFFRFFLSGADQGSAVPSRSEIVNVNDEKRKAILDQRWKQTFKTDLNTYVFKLKVKDMIGIMRYSVSDAKKDEAGNFTYNLVPLVVQSLIPMTFYNNSNFELTVSQKEQENTLKIDPQLLSVIADKSKILQKDKTDDSSPEPTGPTYKTFIDYASSLNLQSAAFINEINQPRVDVATLKNKVLQAKPENQKDFKDNVLNFTIEDYYKAYFGMLIAANDEIPFVQDNTI